VFWPRRKAFNRKGRKERKEIKWGFPALGILMAFFATFAESLAPLAVNS